MYVGSNSSPALRHPARINPMSNSALWAASGRPSTNFKNAASASSGGGASASMASVMPGQTDDLRRQPTAGVHEGLKRIRDLPVFQHHCADLRDGLPLYLQSGSFDVEAHDLVVKVLILRTVYGQCGRPGC